MTHKELRAIRDRAPFQPFTIHLSNGDYLACQHPEMLSCPDWPNQRDCIIWDRGTWNWVDIPNIVRITPALAIA